MRQFLNLRKARVKTWNMVHIFAKGKVLVILFLSAALGKDGALFSVVMMKL